MFLFEYKINISLKSIAHALLKESIVMERLQNSSSREMKRSLFLITIAVIFSKVYFSIVTGAPLTGFLRALGVSDLTYSIIAAMPYIAGAFQIVASYFLEKAGRRKFIFLVSGYVHRLIIIPIALVPFVVPQQYRGIVIIIITMLIIIHSIANAIVTISYMSWMGDIVPVKTKGSFFGKRTALASITGIIASVIAAMYLDNMKSILSFSVVFIFAAIFGAIDTTCFIWVIDPPMKRDSESASGFLTMLVEPFKDKYYTKLIIFNACWSLGFNFSTPFLNIYMLEQLKMSYFNISIMTSVVAGITTALLINKLGIVSDKHGMKPVIRICCCFVAILPILWCFATPSNYLIVMTVAFLLSGLFQQGIGLIMNNFSIWLAPENNRSMYLANFALVSTVFSGLSYIAAGTFMESSKGLISKINNTFFNGQPIISNFHVLFAISSILMVCAIVFILPMVREREEAVEIANVTCPERAI